MVPWKRSALLLGVVADLGLWITFNRSESSVRGRVPLCFCSSVSEQEETVGGQTM